MTAPAASAAALRSEEGSSGSASVELALRMGDNCLILGHHISEWCGHAPTLEDDIATANTALDLIGQARFWLDLAGELEGAGRTADMLAYLRDSGGFRNLLIVELPNGDFARTLMRQFLFDAWHLPMLEGLKGSVDSRISGIAEKAWKEVSYHLDRSADLIVRLGDGNAESHGRMQEALNYLWPYRGEMVRADGIDEALGLSGIGVDMGEISLAQGAWIDRTFEAATLRKPISEYDYRGGKEGVHTEHLGYILAEMQFLQRAYPGLEW